MELTDEAHYSLLADGPPALAWFFAGLPVLIVIAWWWTVARGKLLDT